ncbi:44316_t:CDS:2, partial [Gigaspora margarita]
MLDEHFPNSLIARYYGVNVVHSKMLDEHFPNSLITRYYGVNVVHSNGRVIEELYNKFDKIIEQKREDLVNGNTESDRKDLLLNAES